MYEKHFRFKASPFQLSPDHRFFYESRVHRRALAHLRFGLEQGEGFIVITGEVGAGKTTLVNHILNTLDPRRFVIANVVTTNLDDEDMIRMIASKFDIRHEGRDKASLLRELERFFAATLRRGKRCLLFIDEAQNMRMSALEELRMLSNITVNGKAALQCFLLGQPQFREFLADEDLAQLRQRVIASYHLGALDINETRKYILHRLQLVGWRNHPEFEISAFEAIQEETGGVPRRINTLCSRLLLFCALEELDLVTGDIVRSVAEEYAIELLGPNARPARQTLLPAVEDEPDRRANEEGYRQPAATPVRRAASGDLPPLQADPAPMRPIGAASNENDRNSEDNAVMKRALKMVINYLDGKY